MSVRTLAAHYFLLGMTAMETQLKKRNPLKISTTICFSKAKPE